VLLFAALLAVAVYFTFVYSEKVGAVVAIIAWYAVVGPAVWSVSILVMVLWFLAFLPVAFLPWLIARRIDPRRFS